MAALTFVLVFGITTASVASKEGCSFEEGMDLRCNTDPLNCIGELLQLPELYSPNWCNLRIQHIHALELPPFPDKLQTANASDCCSACTSEPSCAVAIWEPGTKDCFRKWLSKGKIQTYFAPGFCAHHLQTLGVGTQLKPRRGRSVVACRVQNRPSPPRPPQPAPAPPFPFRNHTLPYSVRVADLVSRLTLNEKIAQMARGGAAKNSPTPAIPHLGIEPHIWGTECATGLGSDDSGFSGTSFPQPLGQAATFDTDLIRRVAEATHVEIRAQHNEDMRNGIVQYHHGLNCWSPVVNIMRHWAWGRNDEVSRTHPPCPPTSSLLPPSLPTLPPPFKPFLLLSQPPVHNPLPHYLHSLSVSPLAPCPIPP